MTKKQIIDQITRDTHIDKVDVDAIVNALFVTIKNNCHEAIFFRGFGAFVPVTRKAKVGQNITKKTKVVIPERKVIKFKAYFHLNQ